MDSVNFQEKSNMLCE